MTLPPLQVSRCHQKGLVNQSSTTWVSADVPDVLVPQPLAVFLLQCTTFLAVANPFSQGSFRLTDLDCGITGYLDI
jgi:hypothetical protein